MSELVEIERKFLLSADADERVFYGTAMRFIKQGYLAFDGTEVRVRVETAQPPTLTFKRGDGPVRQELEFPITESRGLELMALAHPYVLSKRRYTLRSWEVDFFADAASPPIAEIELPSIEWPLHAPKWIDTAREVTGDPAYLNRNIARRVGAERDAAAGYHLRHIPKGLLGHVSKIREELEELEGAAVQQNHILQLIEASDVYGALAHFAMSKGVTMSQLAEMSAATQRAFAAGAR